MSVKFPIRDDRVQSLYGLAWSKLASGRKSALERIDTGFEAADSDTEDGAQADEATLLDAALALGRRVEWSPEAVNAIRNRERMEAERELHLMRLGYIGS